MKKTAVILALATLMSWSAFAVDYSLTVTVSPTDSGHVTLDPSEGPYAAGTEVALTPIPSAGYVFSHWEAGLTGNASPASLVMNANKNVTAVFVNEGCTLDEVRILSPRNGATIKVGKDSSDIPVIFSAQTSCVEKTARVTFTLSGGWQTIALMPDEHGLYTITGPTLAGLGYGTHTLYVTATSEDQPELTFEDTVTFTTESTATPVDNDANGLPDRVFATLNVDAAEWISSVIVPETMNRRFVVATRWEGPIEGDPEGLPIVLSIKNPARPAQIVTVSAPRALLKEGESALLIIEMAPDLDTLFGPIETQMLGVEPSLLVGGGQYIEATILMSLDGGSSYAEMDQARLRDNPVHITVKGLDVIPGSSYLLYSHESGYLSNPLYGDRLVAWEGDWSTDNVRNLVISDAAMDADLAGLCILAPYRAPLEGPRLSLQPENGSHQEYGFVTLGQYRDETFTVRNTGGGVLYGTASTTNDAFSVVSGAAFYLDPGEATRVTVRFMPTTTERYIGNVNFTGGGYATINLRGFGYRDAAPLTCSGGSLSGSTPAPGRFIGDVFLVSCMTLAMLLARRTRLCKAQARGR